MRCPMCGSDKITNYFQDYYECGDCGYCDIESEFDASNRSKFMNQKPKWDDENENSGNKKD